MSCNYRSNAFALVAQRSGGLPKKVGMAAAALGAAAVVVGISMGTNPQKWSDRERSGVHELVDPYRSGRVDINLPTPEQAARLTERQGQLNGVILTAPGLYYAGQATAQHARMRLLDKNHEVPLSLVGAQIGFSGLLGMLKYSRQTTYAALGLTVARAGVAKAYEMVQTRRLKKVINNHTFAQDNILVAAGECPRVRRKIDGTLKVSGERATLYCQPQKRNTAGYRVRKIRVKRKTGTFFGGAGSVMRQIERGLLHSEDRK